MASFGKVLDLLEERYLNLQDVIGHVEPLPTLVPYERYAQNVLVYRMDTHHELFMGLIQDFTARMAKELGKELWIWCVQWDVEDKQSTRLDASPPSPKKPRLQSDEHMDDPDEQETQRKKPIIDVFNRRELDPELTKEEDMLRILIDIVQVDSTIVPNFIEFLYRWIDYYEGDGRALKAALKWEIPSLWDFDCHPLVLPADAKKEAEQEEDRLNNEGIIQKNGQTSKSVGNGSAQQLLENLPTKKMREKPDLSALERHVEESERLQYREVKFGIQPPELHQPLPPLINIPRDPAKRVKYYSACFKSRQRAIVLLLEAGVSMQQISNYQKLQTEHPRETPGNGDPKDLKGLRYYHKDAAASQEYFTLKEKLQGEREKQQEITISNKLAVEAQIAAANSTSDGGTSGIPLIPPTPSYPRPTNMAADMLKRLRAAGVRGDERVSFVPAPLVGKLKSKLFEGAKDRRLMQGPGRAVPGAYSPRGQNRALPVAEDSDEDGSGSGESAADIDDVLPSINPATVSRDMAASGQPSQIPVRAPLQSAALLGAAASQASGHQAAVGGNEATASFLAGSQHMTTTTSGATLVFTPSSGPPSVSTAPSLDQPRGASMSSIPPPTQPQTVAVGSGPHHPSLPFMPPLNRPPALLAAPATGLSTQAPVQSPTHSSHSAHSGSWTSPQPFSLALSGEPSEAAQTAPGTTNSPLRGINRQAPSPLNLAPPSPLSSLAPTLLATTPFITPLSAPSNRIPIQIYFPRIVVPGNGIGPLGQRLGDNHAIETDAFLLGYTTPGTGKVELSKALFMPVGCWTNTLRRVRKGAYKVLETYLAPSTERGLPAGCTSHPHKVVYEKLAQGYNIMRSSCTSPQAREDLMTKRWRASPGPMTQRDRGAVWEGWGVTLDRGMEMGAGERKGALLSSWLVDEGVDKRVDEEAERRRRELEELMEEEGWDDMDEDEWCRGRGWAGPTACHDNVVPIQLGT
ncbi:hypothetical protein EK21DRAFT_54177 [Setomelanomma holmii]|uniref:Uncharacterized protein n=1 Tax=Setomelanomma holmii TaxID=210430 RepID=A0A9P4HJ20_9PLEO|nr:hypothetical protein EK21DRAFT_54177 [Setomelanomma holmii]